MVKEKDSNSIQQRSYRSPELLTRRTLDSLLEGCQIIGRDWKYLYVNEAVARQSRSTREQLLGRTMMEVFPGIEKTAMFALLEKCMNERIPQSMENEFEYPDRTTGWFDLKFDPVPEGVFIFSIDISERKRAEAALQHLTAMLRGIRDVNQLITRVRDPQVLVARACELLVEARGFNACCIVLIQDGRATFTAEAGDAAKINALRRMRERDELPDCIVHSLAQRDIVIRRAPKDSCSSCPINDEYTVGRDGVAVPLLHDGRCFGVLLCVLPLGMSDNPEEMSLLSEIAGDIAFALSNIGMQDERDAAQERLRVVGERLAAIVQASPAAIFSLDVLGNVVSWNRAAEQIFGWTAEEAVGRPLPTVSPDKREEHLALRQRVLDGESFSNIEIRRVRKDGSPVTMNLAAAPLRDRNGAINGIMAVALDIGEWLRLESRARYSEERFRALVENLEDVVFSLDAQGAFTYMSPNIAKFGYDRGEFIGQPFSRFVHPDDRPGLQASFERTSSGAIEPFEFRAFDKRGVIRYVRTSSRSIMKNGRSIGMNGIIADITEQRQAQEQLRLAQRMESIGRLAGGVAHDFNNLLTVINNFAVLVDESLPEVDPLRGYLNEIIKAGERAAGLTRQLLAFSRKQVLMPKVINLNLVISDMGKMLRRLIGEDIELVTVLADDLGNVKADPGQIEQVIMNLAINSRDAMPQGGRLSIETANVELDEEYARQHLDVQAGPYVMLALTDNGCGMDEPTLARIFEPFFTTKGPGKGTGLGLATVYGIVKQSGGNVWVYSEQGRGTVVKIYLPREHAAIEAAEQAQPEIAGSRIHETILVVEDDGSLRNLVVQILETVGYKVLSAANGAEALSICEQHGYSIDLMLTDVIMPQMSGKELAGRVAAAYPGLRTLFMSGYTDDAIMHHGVLEPGTDFISKPFSAKELRRKVRRVLDHEPPTPLPTRLRM